MNPRQRTQSRLDDDAMSLNPESKYPTRRTYVVKLRSDATPDALAGRLENVISGSQRPFACGHELLLSIARDLQASGPESATSDDEE